MAEAPACPPLAFKERGSDERCELWQRHGGHCWIVHQGEGGEVLETRRSVEGQCLTWGNGNGAVPRLTVPLKLPIRRWVEKGASRRCKRGESQCGSTQGKALGSQIWTSAAEVCRTKILDTE